MTTLKATGLTNSIAVYKCLNFHTINVEMTLIYTFKPYIPIQQFFLGYFPFIVAGNTQPRHLTLDSLTVTPIDFALAVLISRFVHLWHIPC